MSLAQQHRFLQVEAMKDWKGANHGVELKKAEKAAVVRRADDRMNIQGTSAWVHDRRGLFFYFVQESSPVSRAMVGLLSLSPEPLRAQCAVGFCATVTPR